MKIIKYGFAFGIGAFIYTIIEILWRGYTHWSMSIAGGLSVALIYMWNELLEHKPKPLKWLMGALTITFVEFVAGCIVNLWLHQNVWDYSAMRYDILGQVCLGFTAIWYVLSVPAFYVCELIKKHVDV